MRELVGLLNGARAPELLLAQPNLSGFQRATVPLSPARTSGTAAAPRWPLPMGVYALNYTVCLDGETLWVLASSPPAARSRPGQAPEQNLPRHAVLFGLEPGETSALAIGLEFALPGTPVGGPSLARMRQGRWVLSRHRRDWWQATPLCRDCGLSRGPRSSGDGRRGGRNFERRAGESRRCGGLPGAQTPYEDVYEHGGCMRFSDLPPTPAWRAGVWRYCPGLSPRIPRTARARAIACSSGGVQTTSVEWSATVSDETRRAAEQGDAKAQYAVSWSELEAAGEAGSRAVNQWGPYRPQLKPLSSAELEAAQAKWAAVPEAEARQAGLAGDRGAQWFVSKLDNGRVIERRAKAFELLKQAAARSVSARRIRCGQILPSPGSLGGW